MTLFKTMKDSSAWQCLTNQDNRHLNYWKCSIFFLIIFCQFLQNIYLVWFICSTVSDTILCKQQSKIETTNNNYYHHVKYLSVFASLIIALSPSSTSNEFGIIWLLGKMNPYRPVEVQKQNLNIFRTQNFFFFI